MCTSVQLTYVLQPGLKSCPTNSIVRVLKRKGHVFLLKLFASCLCGTRPKFGKGPLLKGVPFDLKGFLLNSEDTEDPPFSIFEPFLLHTRRLKKLAGCGSMFSVRGAGPKLGKGTF